MAIKVTMPALSPTMTEGTLAKWLVKEGDEISSGDVIAEIETDKATMEVESADEGIVGKILVEAGTENVAVNDIIAVLLEEGESPEAAEDAISEQNNNQTPKTESKPPQSEKKSVNPPTTSVAAQNTANSETSEGNGARIFASPLARRLAEQKNIDLSTLTGSGPHGRIVKADIENYNPATKPATQNQTKVEQSKAATDTKELINAYGMEYEEIPNNNIKKITAQRLQESKQNVPHFYLTIECKLDALLAARKQINDKADGAYKLSVNDFIVKACANALNRYPAANVSWTDDAVLQYKHADISVAVATPNGLITPIVKHAETKGLKQISEEIKELAGRARENKLKPEEFQGGTFSVSNLGMFGIQEFGAIINPPQACILAVGAGEQKPYAENGEIKIGTFMRCTLSVDHRAVDGAVGAEYLKILKQYIEDPLSMLV